LTVNYLKKRNNKNKIGLALGGGGARGLAHIGVLKVLEENGIRPDIIAGTSIGSIIGSLYASGLKPEEIERLVTGLDWKNRQLFVDPALSLNGLIQGKRITSLLESILGDLTFDDLVRDFTCVATDIENGEPVFIRQGSLVQAIRASISIPGVFVPAKIGGRYLVDGGLVMQVPASVCRDMSAEFVIAVNVVPNPAGMMPESGKITRSTIRGTREKILEITDEIILTPSDLSSPRLAAHQQGMEKVFEQIFRRPTSKKVTDISVTRKIPERESFSRAPSMIDVLIQCFTITGYRIALEDMRHANLQISPEIGSVGFWQYDRAEDAIAAGEEAAREAISKDKRILSYARAPSLEID
jgi:NTE family protein